MSQEGLESYFELKHKIETEVEFPDSFRELIERAADLYPDQLAVNFFDQGKALRFSELRDSVFALADSFTKRGIGHGSHVAVLMNNRIEFPLSWLALAVMGAVIVPVNPAYTATELDYVLNDADVEFAIVEAELLHTFQAMQKRPEILTDDRLIVVGGPTEGVVSWHTLMSSGDPASRPGSALTANDLLNIQYTSGTTGFPKGCVQTQRYWLLLGCMIGYSHDDIESVLADAPFFYMDPQWMLVMGLYSGATVHCPSRPSVRKFLDWAEEYQIEMAYFPLPLLEVEASERDAATPIKFFLGYALDAVLTRIVEERFNAIARDSFGMTEIGPGLMVPEEADSDAALNSCGLPTPFRKVKIVDDDGRELGPGEKGELLVAGDGIIQGYYNKPAENAESFVDGWFKTGDIFVADEHGFYTIVGRKKDMIRRSSENISALEVETALYALPGVSGVAAVAVPDARRDEEVKVYLELADGVTPDDLCPEKVISHCNERLAPFKVPRYIEYVGELPYTPSEKVAKHKLREQKEDLRQDSWDELDQCWR